MVRGHRLPGAINHCCSNDLVPCRMPEGGYLTEINQYAWPLRVFLTYCTCIVKSRKGDVSQVSLGQGPQAAEKWLWRGNLTVLCGNLVKGIFASENE